MDDGAAVVGNLGVDPGVTPVLTTVLEAGDAGPAELETGAGAGVTSGVGPGVTAVVLQFSLQGRPDTEKCSLLYNWLISIHTKSLVNG